MDSPNLLTKTAILAQTVWSHGTQYFRGNVVQRGKERIVSYAVANKTYKVRTTPKRGPCPIKLVVNHRGVDITHEILPWMGPRYDWHHDTFTPSDFKQLSIAFTLRNGDVKRFFLDEPMVVI